MQIDIKITEYEGLLYKQQMTGRTGRYIISTLKKNFFYSSWKPLRQCVSAGFHGAFFDYRIFNSMEEIYEYFYNEYPTIKKECFKFVIYPGNKIIVPVNPLS